LIKILVIQNSIYLKKYFVNLIVY